MSALANQVANVLTVFMASTGLSLALEWGFGDYVKTTNMRDIWIQFFAGFSQFFIYVVAAPQLVYLLYSPSIYGAPGMTASLTFFWGFLFQTNMRAKIIDWYQLAVDPSQYKKSSSSSSCASGDGSCAQ